MPRPDVVRLVALLLVLRALAPATARAQGAGPADISTLPLDELLLDAPIAAASLEQERVSDAPAAVFVLTAEDLHTFGFRTLGEALSSTPGLFGYRDDFLAMTGVRGVGLLMDYGTRLLVLVDGHPLNDGLGLGGSLVDRDLPVPLDAVKRIEVVKGPVGSLYGPSAFLGVVNVVTFDPDDRAGGARAWGSAARDGGRGAETSVVFTGRDGALGVTAGADLAGSRADALRLPELLVPLDGRAPPSSPWVHGREGSGAGYLRLTWRNLGLAGACGELARRSVTAPYGALVGDPRNLSGAQHCFAALDVSGALGARLEGRVRLAYDRRVFRDAFAYDPPPEDVGVARDLGRDGWASADARLTARAAEGTRLALGAIVQSHRTLQRVRADGVPSTAVDPVNGYGPADIEKDFLTLNLYAQADQAVATTLRLHASATFHHHALYGNRLTPKAAAVWNPAPGTALKAVFSRGFRAPTVSEAFYEDGVAYLANPGLRPETATAGELVADRALGEHATLSASLHASRYASLIRFASVPAPGATDPAEIRQQGVNEGHVDVVGAELSGTVRLGRWLRGHGGLALQHARSHDVNFPAVTGNFALATRALWRPLSLAVVLRGASARAKDPANGGAGGGRVPASVALDLTARLEVPSVPGLTLEAAATNALATAGADPLLADNAPVTSMPAAPPRLTLGLAYHFQ